MSVRHPDTLSEYKRYRKKDGLVVVKYGANWCGPCRSIVPVMKKLAKEYPNDYFIDVDVDNEEIDYHPDLSDVGTIPHVKFFVDGKLKNEIKGADRKSLEKYVARYSKKDTQDKNKKEGKTFEKGY